MAQTGLINNILEVMNMEDYNMKYTPADKVTFNKDLDDPPTVKSDVIIKLWEYYYNWREAPVLLLYMLSINVRDSQTNQRRHVGLD